MSALVTCFVLWTSFVVDKCIGRDGIWLLPTVIYTQVNIRSISSKVVTTENKICYNKYEEYLFSAQVLYTSVLYVQISGIGVLKIICHFICDCSYAFSNSLMCSRTYMSKMHSHNKSFKKEIHVYGLLLILNLLLCKK